MTERAKKALPFPEGPPRYGKRQLAASGRYPGCQDLLEALFQEGETYTLEEADRLVQEFLKGGKAWR